jgi:hypothetical protein
VDGLLFSAVGALFYYKCSWPSAELLPLACAYGTHPLSTHAGGRGLGLDIAPELIGSETHSTTSTPASAVGSEASVARSWRSVLAHRARGSPFWRRGTFVDRAGRYGGVQVIVEHTAN